MWPILKEKEQIIVLSYPLASSWCLEYRPWAGSNLSREIIQAATDCLSTPQWLRHCLFLEAMDLTCILIWAVLLQLCLFRSESLSGPFSLYIPRASHLLLMDISVSRRRLLFLLQAERSIQSLHLVCFAIYLLRAGSLFIFVLFQELQTGLLVCLCNCTISCISLSIWLLDSSLPSDFLLQHGHLLKKHIKLDTHAHDTPCSLRPSWDFQILILQDPFQLKWFWFSTTEEKTKEKTLLLPMMHVYGLWSQDY